MTDHFCHRLKVDHIRHGERIDLVAEEAERGSIAERLRLERLDCLQAHATLTRNGVRIEVEGRIVASLIQSCVVTGQPLPAHIDEAFSLLFMPEPETSRSDEEIELAPSDCDVVFYEAGTIDLGSAIADTLALSLDPYPRSAEADAALKEAGIMSEAEAGPFAALAQLKKGSDAS